MVNKVIKRLHTVLECLHFFDTVGVVMADKSYTAALFNNKFNFSWWCTPDQNGHNSTELWFTVVYGCRQIQVWNEHITNKQLYGKLPNVSKKIAVRRIRQSGHCHRHQELPTIKLVLWEPTHGRRSAGRPKPTYVDVLKKDAGTESTNELARCMENRDDWKRRWRARLRTT